MKAKDQKEEAEDDAEEDEREGRVISLYHKLLGLNDRNDLVTFKKLESWNNDSEVLHLLEELEWKGKLETIWFLLDCTSKGEVSLSNMRDILVLNVLPLDAVSVYHCQ